MTTRSTHSSSVGRSTPQRRLERKVCTAEAQTLLYELGADAGTFPRFLHSSICTCSARQPRVPQPQLHRTLPVALDDLLDVCLVFRSQLGPPSDEGRYVLLVDDCL